MKSIIDLVYFEDLTDVAKFNRDLHGTEEIKAHDRLVETLNIEQKRMLADFIDLRDNSKPDRIKEAYVAGFQSGARLAFEIMGADFTVKFP